MKTQHEIAKHNQTSKHYQWLDISYIQSVQYIDENHQVGTLYKKILHEHYAYLVTLLQNLNHQYSRALLLVAFGLVSPPNNSKKQ